MKKTCTLSPLSTEGASEHLPAASSAVGWLNEYTFDILYTTVTCSHVFCVRVEFRTR